MARKYLGNSKYVKQLEDHYGAINATLDAYQNYVNLSCQDRVVLNQQGYEIPIFCCFPFIPTTTTTTTTPAPTTTTTTTTTLAPTTTTTTTSTTSTTTTTPTTSTTSTSTTTSTTTTAPTTTTTTTSTTTSTTSTTSTTTPTTTSTTTTPAPTTTTSTTSTTTTPVPTTTSTTTTLAPTTTTTTTTVPTTTTTTSTTTQAPLCISDDCLTLSSDAIPTVHCISGTPDDPTNCPSRPVSYTGDCVAVNGNCNEQAACQAIFASLINIGDKMCVLDTIYSSCYASVIQQMIDSGCWAFIVTTGNEGNVSPCSFSLEGGVGACNLFTIIEATQVPV